MSHHNGATVSDVRPGGGGDVHSTGQKAAAQRAGEREETCGSDC